MAVRIDLALKTISLGVSDLLSEAGRAPLSRGGLGSWTRATLGREAHASYQTTQSTRQLIYSAELCLQHRTTVDDFSVTIRGRLDGVIPPATNVEPWIVEEVKSVILPPLQFASLTPDHHPSYIEQLRLYCHFVSVAKQHSVEGRLTFINLADNTVRQFRFEPPFDDCAALIADRVRALINQAVANQQRHAARCAAAAVLSFPYERPRPHQDALIDAVTRAMAAGRHLLVNAPSGIGKTVGTLFPAVQHALSHNRRVFYVTARNTQQTIALTTLERIGAATAIQIRAREKMCINSVYACREEFCPHLSMLTVKAQRTGTLDRLRDRGCVTADHLIEAGRAVSCCPFELGLILAEQTDVTVCDYNYVFDPQVYLRRFFLDNDYSDAILVIDEAHNLLSRALDYYSPVLRRCQVHHVSRNLRHLEPGLARDFRRALRLLDEIFETLVRRHGDEYSQVDPSEGAPSTEESKFLIESPCRDFEEVRQLLQRLAVRYLLDKATRGIAMPDDPVDEFLARFNQYVAVLDMDGEEFSHVFQAGPDTAIEIVCKDPSRFLARRIEGFHSVIAMSATLTPLEFYQQMLGFDPDRTDTIALPSPFNPARRRIIIVPNILTTFRARASHYDRIAEIITTTTRGRPGNYMALFPSYDFLRAVASHFDATGPTELLTQKPRMSDAERAELLAALQSSRPPKLVLAVQGGLFAEGVDFAGDLLIGVIVVSPALPQVSFERELMRQYYQERYGKGFEFAYLYPGMNRVIQSVGRLIRAPTDQGVAVLVCQRFKQNAYSELFPPDWAASLTEARTTADLSEELTRFWQLA